MEYYVSLLAPVARLLCEQLGKLHLLAYDRIIFGPPAIERRLNGDHDAIEVVAGTNATGYSSVAAMVFLIYDILITLDDEVKYIWPNPWTIPKVLYFFLRYFTVILHVSIMFLGTPPFTFTNHECYIWNIYQAISTTLLIAAIDYILIVRIFALYPRNPWVTIGTTVAYICELVAITVGAGLSVPKFVVDEYCTVLETPMVFLLSAAAPMAFQTLLFVLTIWKFGVAVKAGWGNVPLVRLLVRDGTWAFILLFVLYVAQAMLYGLASSAYSGILFGWLNTAFAFCGSHIIININATSRARQERRAAVNTSTINPTTGPDIQFTTRIETSGFSHYGTMEGDSELEDSVYQLAVIPTLSEVAESGIHSTRRPRSHLV